MLYGFAIIVQNELEENQNEKKLKPKENYETNLLTNYFEVYFILILKDLAIYVIGDKFEYWMYFKFLYEIHCII
jgi:hypothetical protein